MLVVAAAVPDDLAEALDALLVTLAPDGRYHDDVAMVAVRRA